MQPVVVQRDEDAAPPRKPPKKDKDYDAKPSRGRRDDEGDEAEYYESARRAESKPKKSSSRYDDDDGEAAGGRSGGRRGPGHASSYRDEEEERPRRRKNDDDDEWGGAKPSKDTRKERGDAGTGSATAKSSVRPLDLSNMRAFLTQPLPKDAGVVQCYIRRNKNGTNKLFPVYSLYLKDGDRFLLCSKKRPNNTTSNYLISMGENDLNRTGSNYLGKLRSNFMGTEFQVFDDGCNPKEDRGGPGGLFFLLLAPFSIFAFSPLTISSHPLLSPRRNLQQCKCGASWERSCTLPMCWAIVAHARCRWRFRPWTKPVAPPPHPLVSRTSHSASRTGIYAICLTSSTSRPAGTSR